MTPILFGKRYTAGSETGCIWLLTFLDVQLVAVSFEKRALPQTIHFIFKMLAPTVESAAPVGSLPGYCYMIPREFRQVVTNLFPLPQNCSPCII